MLRKKYAFSGHGRLQMSVICFSKHLQKRQKFPAGTFGAREPAIYLFRAMARQKPSIREPVRLAQS